MSRRCVGLKIDAFYSVLEINVDLKINEVLANECDYRFKIRRI